MFQFLTGVGSIQTPYFSRIGSSLVIQPAKPGDSWSSDIFWVNCRGRWEERIFPYFGKGCFFQGKMVGSLERHVQSFKQKMKENDTDTAHQHSTTTNRDQDHPLPFPNPTNTTVTQEAKPSQAKPSQGFPRLTQYKAGARLSITSSSGKARSLVGCFYIHSLLSCCFLISEMPFTMLYPTHDHTHLGLGPSSLSFTTYLGKNGLDYVVIEGSPG
jgi:hypothetical protein